MWCPVPYRTVSLIDIGPSVDEISYRPRVPSLVERVTVAAVFAWPPAEPALDAAGGGSGPRDGGIRGVPHERHLRLHYVTSTPSGADNDIVPFNPKHVVMEEIDDVVKDKRR